MAQETVEVSRQWQEEIQDALIRAEDELDAVRLALNLAKDEIAALKAGVPTADEVRERDEARALARSCIKRLVFAGYNEAFILDVLLQFPWVQERPTE